MSIVKGTSKGKTNTSGPSKGRGGYAAAKGRYNAVKSRIYVRKHKASTFEATVVETTNNTIDSFSVAFKILTTKEVEAKRCNAYAYLV